jgi:hypothetical protein
LDIVQTLNSEDNMRIWAELLNAEFTDYNDYMTKYDSSINPQYFGKRGAIWYNYNAIVYLLMDGNINYLVYKLVGLLSTLQWNKWGEIILEIREKQRIPNYFAGFEYLVNEIKKFEQKHPELREQGKS